MAELIEAMQEGDIDLAIELVRGDTDVNATDAFGNTALMFAAEGNPDPPENPEDDPYIHLITALIEAGADPNMQNNEGKTAVMIAEENGNTYIVQKLTSIPITPPSATNVNIRNAANISEGTGEGSQGGRRKLRRRHAKKHATRRHRRHSSHRKGLKKRGTRRTHRHRKQRRA